MDFARALMFPFDDDEWIKKIGIGALISLIPIAGQLALGGWGFDLSKRVKANDPKPLPDWSEFGALIGKGLTIVLGYLMYIAPGLLFICLGYALLIGAGAASNGDEDVVGPASIVQICCSCLAVLAMIAGGIVFAGGYVRFLDRDEFSTFTQFGENIAIVRENIGDFGMLFIYGIVGGLIASFAAGITLGIGTLLLPIFQAYFYGHLVGQLAIKLSGGSMAAGPQV